MRYRKLDANYDMSFGRSANDFYVNVPEAPAQAVLTRLMLHTNEYFLNLNDGTPWETKVLGKRTERTRDAVIQSRILGTPQVTGIKEYSSLLTRDTRAFTGRAVIDTAYGPVTIPEPQ